MSTNLSTSEEPSTITILTGAANAVRESPAILGVFLISGILGSIIPDFLDSAISVVAMSFGIAIAYRALGGQVRTELSMVLRMSMGWVAVFISGMLTLLGLVALLLPGLYVLTRLFLALPAVIIDGYGPFQALSESWRLMDGSILTAGGALCVVIVGAFIVLVPVLMSPLSPLVANIAGSIIGGSLSVGIQVFLYMELTDS
ncbi:glycerophosphoryl diester phosphodiesterase membrane domain-containing protein [Halocatena marina]|uniref:Glycerophosphoryl diester phosphodiesterase membrane domain-containing protein n=1 Tax=Halocatena marina TaxID=2934937 RepID=A0ABD5YUN5_9EURY|nr:glycerophosphoryl diester phosphodiesterase membrane domain-containing protein [Halocatena marina]